MVRSKIVFIFLIFIITVIFLIIYFPNEQSSNSNVPQIHDKNADVLDTSDEYPTKNPDDNRSENRNAKESDKGIVTQKPEPKREFIVKIHDALGEPIPSGTITDGTETIGFANGVAYVPETDRSENTILITANGYTPKTCDRPWENSSIITLEYVTNYTLQVFEESNNEPAPNADIHVWTCEAPPRPVTHHIDDIPFIIGTSSGVSLRSDGIYFDDNTTTEKLKKGIDPRGFGWVQEGDQLVNIVSCSWDKTYPPYYHNTHAFWKDTFLPADPGHSSKLRLWDTLSLLENREHRDEVYQPGENALKFEFERNGRRAHHYLKWPELPKNYIKHQILKTSQNGICTIQNATPSLYYVQAMKENTSSKIIPLLPCYGGTTVSLKNNSELKVEFASTNPQPKTDNILNPTDAAKQTVTLTLKSLSQQGIYTKQTDFYNDGSSPCFIVFKDLPYGEYKINLGLPSNLSPADSINTITINEPKETLLIRLKNQAKRFSATGRVVTKDNKKPVAGFEMVVLKNVASSETITQKISSCITNQDGEYQFENLLSGTYGISANYTNLENLDYLPVQIENFAVDQFLHEFDPSIPFNDKIPIKRIQIKNSDLQVEDFVVVPTCKMQISGMVINENNEPVSNAIIRCWKSRKFSSNLVNKDSLATFPPEIITDNKGHFAFTIISRPKPSYEYTFDIELAAFVEEKSEGQWQLSNEWIGNTQTASFKDGQTFILKSGSIHLKGEFNKNYNNVIIHIKEEGNKTIHGEVVLDENSLHSVSITAKQFGKELSVTKHNNNLFTVHGASSGEVLLTINPKIKNSIQTPAGTKEYNKYQKTIKTIHIPQEQESIETREQLVKCGYVWGYVRKPENSPMINCTLFAFHTIPDRDIHKSSVTDDNGFYCLTDLIQDEEYYLQIYDESGNLIYKTNYLTPPINNHTILME